MGGFCQLQASSPITSRFYKAYPAVTGVMGYNLIDTTDYGPKNPEIIQSLMQTPSYTVALHSDPLVWG